MRNVLKAVGIAYGILGVVTLVSLVGILLHGPDSRQISQEFISAYKIFYVSVLGVLLLMTLLNFLLMYSFIKLKRWGWMLALVANSFFGILCLSWYSSMGSITTEASERTWDIALFFVFYVSVIVLCLRKDVKDLLIN
jgi:hypothetical protein